MQSHQSTTPFGRRSLTLGHVATQTTAKARPPDKAVHKWKVFRAICTAKARPRRVRASAGRSRRVLSFHPETTLSGEDLIVFPSNQQLCPARPWHAGLDIAAASGGAGRLRAHHSARQPERQALRAEGRGGEIKSHSVSTCRPRGARRGIRGPSGGTRGGERAP